MIGGFADRANDRLVRRTDGSVRPVIALQVRTIELTLLRAAIVGNINND